MWDFTIVYSHMLLVYMLHATGSFPLPGIDFSRPRLFTKGKEDDWKKRTSKIVED